MKLTDISHRARLILCAAAILGALGGCRKAPDSDLGGISAGPAREMVLQFRVAPEDALGDEPSVAAKAVADADQGKVATLQVLQYSDTTGGEGRLLSCSPRVAVNAPAAGITQTFPVRPADKCHFIVLANCPEVEIAPKGYNEAVSSAFQLGDNPAAMIDTMTRIPMAGIAGPVNIPVVGRVPDLSVPLVRLFARVVVSVTVGSGLPGFRIVSMQAKNMPVAVPYVPSKGEPTAAQMADSRLVSATPATGVTKWENVAFIIPENRQGQAPWVTDPFEKYGDGKPLATYIEVAGDHTVNGRTDRYLLRLYPGANATTDYNLQRNGSYTLRMTLKALDPRDRRLRGGVPWFEKNEISVGGYGDTVALKVHGEFKINPDNWPSWLTSQSVPAGIDGSVTSLRIIAAESNVTGVERAATITLRDAAGQSCGTLTVTQPPSLFACFIDRDSPLTRILWPTYSKMDEESFYIESRYTAFTAVIEGLDASHFEIVDPRPSYGSARGIGVYRLRVRPTERTTNSSTMMNARLVLTPTEGLGNNLLPRQIVELQHVEATVSTANCFLVTPGQSFRFNATRAGSSSTSLIATKSVGILWQTAADGVYDKALSGGRLVLGNPGSVLFDPSNGNVTVTTSSTMAGTGGNALLAAYSGPDGTGNILWSWHIWVTDYNPLVQPDGTALGSATRQPNTAINVHGGQVHTYSTLFQTAAGKTKTIMDRNLGATKAYYGPPAAGDPEAYKSFGFFYQWGRKDPFIPWNGVNPSFPNDIKIYDAAGNELRVGAQDDTSAPGLKRVSVTAAAGTGNALNYSIANPLTFIYSNGGKFDWYTLNGTQSTLWTTSQGKYDPCPNGWKVPKDGTWGDVGTNPYAAPFWYYINGVRQTAAGKPAFVASASNGRLYEAGNVRAWYPAPGYRAREHGQMTSYGNSGYSWAFTVSGTDGRNLGFHATHLNPSLANNRAYGLQVRCVQI